AIINAMMVIILCTLTIIKPGIKFEKVNGISSSMKDSIIPAITPEIKNDPIKNQNIDTKTPKPTAIKTKIKTVFRCNDIPPKTCKFFIIIYTQYKFYPIFY